MTPAFGDEYSSAPSKHTFWSSSKRHSSPPNDAKKNTAPSSSSKTPAALMWPSNQFTLNTFSHSPPCKRRSV